MPRDLTDLMERATSFAPPEPHAATDITRLAARRQQRRTTSIAAGLAVGMVAAGVIGYGTTRSGDRTPKPVGPVPGRLHQSVADAVPPSSVPGFETIDYGVPSVASNLGPLAPAGAGQYADVDAGGRLMVMRMAESGGSTPRLSATYELIGGSGQTPRPWSAAARSRRSAGSRATRGPAAARQARRHR
jgi:hypothetical protein